MAQNIDCTVVDNNEGYNAIEMIKPQCVKMQNDSISAKPSGLSKDHV